jgi:hypothetical protein
MLRRRTGDAVVRCFVNSRRGQLSNTQVLVAGAPTMKIWRLLLTLAALVTFGVASAEKAPESWDGLVQVKPKRLDAAYVLPGADFRAYTKVMIDPTQVAFRKDWLRNINRSRLGVADDVSQKDADRILADARADFSDVFASAFTRAGYQVVTAPAADVLRVSPSVIDLYINAPDTPTAGRTRTYAMESGEARLVIEVRDSVSGALLGRAVDRRETQYTGELRWSNGVTNGTDFRNLVQQWAATCTKGLKELKEQSPVPADLKPLQTL